MRPAGIVVVANAGRRLDLFRRAAESASIEVLAVPWIDVLCARVSLAHVFGRREGWALRIDSPGEDAEVERELRALGGTLPGACLEPDLARSAPFERGLIFAPRQLALGLELALARIEEELRGIPFVALQDPAALALATDKKRCHAHFVRSGVPVPDALDVAVSDYATLRASLTEHGWTRAFVKLQHGSSASGVIALSIDRHRALAITSVERDGSKLYNSLRVRRYERERDVAAIVDALAPEGLHVERWIPKAALDGRNLDLRALAIAGRSAHTVVRTSEGPLTNLHLGNRRGDLDRFFARLGEGASSLHAVVERAAACFPRNLHLGLDVAIDSHWRHVFVLEANAFGDLLPGALHRGLDPWQAQIEALIDGRFTRAEAA